MATFTTKLALRKPNPTPVTGDLVDAAADLNTNWDKVDAAVGMVICTSTTRPSTPFVSQPAYETDTDASIICISIGPPVWRYTSIPRVSSLSARNALTVYAGLRAFRFDIGVEQYYNGSVWLSTGVSEFKAFASSDLTLTTGDLNIAGASVTVATTAVNAIARVGADFDFELTGTGTGYCYGSLFIGGVRQSKQILFNENAAARVPGSGHWEVVLATVGSYTLNLGGHKDIAAGTAIMRSAGTMIRVQLTQV